MYFVYMNKNIQIFCNYNWKNMMKFLSSYFWVLVIESHSECVALGSLSGESLGLCLLPILNLYVLSRGFRGFCVSQLGVEMMDPASRRPLPILVFKTLLMDFTGNRNGATEKFTTGMYTALCLAFSPHSSYTFLTGWFFDIKYNTICRILYTHIVMIYRDFVFRTIRTMGTLFPKHLIQ